MTLVSGGSEQAGPAGEAPAGTACGLCQAETGDAQRQKAGGYSSEGSV